MDGAKIKLMDNAHPHDANRILSADLLNKAHPHDAKRECGRTNFRSTILDDAHPLDSDKNKQIDFYKLPTLVSRTRMDQNAKNFDHRPPV